MAVENQPLITGKTTANVVMYQWGRQNTQRFAVMTDPNQSRSLVKQLNGMPLPVILQAWSEEAPGDDDAVNR